MLTLKASHVLLVADALCAISASRHISSHGRSLWTHYPLTAHLHRDHASEVVMLGSAQTRLEHTGVDI